MNKLCPVCGQCFSALRRRIYCSFDCLAVHRRALRQSALVKRRSRNIRVNYIPVFEVSGNPPEYFSEELAGAPWLLDTEESLRALYAKGAIKRENFELRLARLAALRSGAFDEIAFIEEFIRELFEAGGDAE